MTVTINADEVTYGLSIGNSPYFAFFAAFDSFAGRLRRSG